ncbi:MAG: MazG-like family protein [Candidatus Ventricola sp.]
MQKTIVMKTVSLNDLRDAIYWDAVAHGLWDGDTIRWECAALIRSEVDELLCESTNWEDDGTAFAEGLSDVIIMSLSVAGKLGIDIDAAVKRKMEINKRRPWKHGKEDA